MITNQREAPLVPRSRRSVLYLPASNLRAIEKARTLPCDGVILDLEDGVAPEAKGIAREQAVAAVRSGQFGAREVIVRVNGSDTEWGAEDLMAIGQAVPDAILLPKINSAAELLGYERRLGAACEVPLWAMIETTRSVLAIGDIAAAATVSRLVCLVMGTNDLAKETGSQPDKGRTPFLGILGLSVVAARAYGLAILDGVYNDLEDLAGFAQECRQAVAFGFDGKTLIHPRQIEGCNATFSPDAEAIAWAERVIRAFEEPANADKGALRVDGKMVERLHLEQARRVLARV